MNVDSVSSTLAILLLFFNIWKTGGSENRGGRYKRYAFRDPVISYDDDLYADNYEEYDNGVLPVLLSVLTDQMLDDLRSETVNHVNRLSEAQAMAVKDKLKGLYANLKNHPALMERRLYVGSKKPEFSMRNTQQIRKRDYDLEIAQPVCPARTVWRLLRHAKDINDTDVEVYQPSGHGAALHGQQWFYTVECKNSFHRSQRDCPDCCMGINHVRFSSSCRERQSYVMALVRLLGRPDLTFDWNWIHVDTSCNCAITPKFTSRRGLL